MVVPGLNVRSDVTCDVVVLDMRVLLQTLHKRQEECIDGRRGAYLDVHCCRLARCIVLASILEECGYLHRMRW